MTASLVLLACSNEMITTSAADGPEERYSAASVVRAYAGSHAQSQVPEAPVSAPGATGLAVELVWEGSFERGNFAGWSHLTTGSPLSPWAVSTGAISGWFERLTPQHGHYVAWNGFDGAGPMEFRLWQDLVIPENVSATLTWQEKIRWDFTLGSFASEPRTFSVQIRDPGTNAVLDEVFSFSTGTQATNPTGNTGWQSHGADISAFAGRTVRLLFLAVVPQNFTGPGQLEIDAVSVLATTLNRAPSVQVGGPFVGAEGAAVALGLGGSDPDGDPLTYMWDLGDGTVGSGAVPPLTHTYDDNGTYVITLIADDGKGGTDTQSTIATIANVAPTITSVSGPSAPLALNSSASITVQFNDPGTLDSHSAVIDWGNGVTSHADVTSGFRASQSYAESGVYRVHVTVADNDGGSGAHTFEYIVVYDPSAGFVTGGGWIRYADGSCQRICGGAGRGDFGFVSRYQKGRTTPSGDTRFQFHAGSLVFESVAYEWLVVSGARAQFKGTGKLNGSGDYGFLLTAIDGEVSGGGGTDRFRIKIWDRTTGETVFDNQSGADETGDSSTALDRVNGNGSVVIHAK